MIYSYLPIYMKRKPFLETLKNFLKNVVNQVCLNEYGKTISKDDKSTEKGNVYLKDMRLASKFLHCYHFSKSQ